ncbi:extracellular solute-binding protein [Ruania alba]|uniref:Putative aldouronate transport system substrate-binding protein n=1 Tax=Ruania alba TaxID=648782 RepID=A0A1H5LUU0_9MICO|nr:extracellular solute-binding protein [Ruania alba]SEE80161.1 putative aldouronate transport system substrate-binding protein [Ruania alba]
MNHITKRWRYAPAVAAATAGALALTACSGGSDGNEGGGGGGTLQVLVLKHPLTGSMADMAWVGDLEETAGVTIEWEEVSADWDQKKSTMLAAGDIPDLIVGVNSITNADQATFTGLFEDLSDDMDALPNVAAMFEALPETEQMATSTDGEIYGLPSYRRFWPDTATRQFINQQWLDTLGLEEPTTWDELHEVLLAFKEEDANGNGDPNDEIPMDWAPAGDTGFGFFQPTVLLGSLGMPISDGGGQGYFVEDGQVGNFLNDERYRDLIAFLHELYADGLISQDVMTQDYSAYQSVARGDGDDARVGFTWGWTGSDRVGAQLADQYSAMSPLMGDASMDPSELTWSYDAYGLNYGVNSITMSAQSDNREAALAVINGFYDQDISVQSLWGDLGENVESTGEGSYEVLPPADGETDPSSWKWTTTLADNSPGWIRDDIEVTLPSDLQEAVEQYEPLADAVENVDPTTDIFPGALIRMSEEDLNQLSLNNTAVFGIAMQRWATWITEGGVEDEWDAYVAEVEGSGLTQNIEIHQSYYDEFAASQG